MAAGSFGAALEVIEALESLGVGYHLGGSLASTVHGIPRQTLDVDLVADLRAEQVERLVGLLEDRFYIDVERVQEAIVGSDSFNLVHLSSGLKVDLFLPGKEEFDREESRRRVCMKIQAPEPREIWVKSPEDTVLRKLLWFRDGGCVSERQWRDVLGVLKVQGDRLDFDYLAHWADRLDLNELLKKARTEA